MLWISLCLELSMESHWIWPNFSSIFNKYDSIVVLKLIGVPDRWYLCPVEKGLEWIERIVTNVGNKVRLEDSEVTDFLRRAQASYAIFDIQTETSSRMYAIWITTWVDVKLSHVLNIFNANIVSAFFPCIPPFLPSFSNTVPAFALTNFQISPLSWFTAFNYTY